MAYIEEEGILSRSVGQEYHSTGVDRDIVRDVVGLEEVHELIANHEELVRIFKDGDEEALNELIRRQDETRVKIERKLDRRPNVAELRAARIAAEKILKKVS